MAEDYEIVSRDELQRLQREVEKLKGRPQLESSESLIEAMDKLSGHIAHLIRIFSQADRELASEFQSGVKSQGQKIDRVIEQNEKIARGLIAVADIVQNPEHAGGRASSGTQSAPVSAEHTDDTAQTPAQETSGTYPLAHGDPDESAAREELMRAFR